MKELVLLKLGGSVITDKTKPFTANYKNLRRLAKEISSAYKSSAYSLILVHGAGSFGHAVVKKYGIDKGLKKKSQIFGFAEAQKVQEELDDIVVKELQRQGLPAISCQPSSCAIMESGRLKEMNAESVKGFLKVGLIPVMYGVPAYDKDSGCSILSGDEIVSFLARSLSAKRVIFGFDEDYVFTSDPKLDKKAIPILVLNKEHVSDLRSYSEISKNRDSTKGMLGKLEKIFTLAGSGCEIELVNANKPSIIERCLKGERGLGTTVNI
jgi:isopentenyl phosphate kinase